MVEGECICWEYIPLHSNTFNSITIYSNTFDCIVSNCIQIHCNTNNPEDRLRLAYGLRPFVLQRNTKTFIYIPIGLIIVNPSSNEDRERSSPKGARDGKSQKAVNINLIKEVVRKRKGANLSVVIERPVKTLAAHKANSIIKTTKIVIRGGVEYDNIGAVQELRESGVLPAENAGLPWGEWAEYPLHISHKGSDYARFYPASGIGFQPKVTYTLNGVEVDKAQIQTLCLSSEFAKKEEAPLCFTIKAENVKDIIL